MDIGRALTFFTEEDRWVEKTAIGVGILLASSILSVVLVGIVGFMIVVGYCIRLMRNVQNGVKPVLPEWNQWGDDFVRGAKLLGIQIVWALPLILVIIPTIIGSAIAEGGSGGPGEAFGALLILCGSCLTVIYAIFIALLQPGYTIAFARNERFGDGLQLSAIWRWTRNHLGSVIIVTLVYICAGLVVSLVGSLVGVILCVVGLLVTVPLAQLVVYYIQYHMYGQLEPNVLSPSTAAGPTGNDYGFDYASEQPTEPTAPAPPPPPAESAGLSREETLDEPGGESVEPESGIGSQTDETVSSEDEAAEDDSGDRV